NVLKQDRIIYDDEGYSVGLHDGRYKLGKYTIDGYSENFYKQYEEGYNYGYENYDSKGFEKDLNEYFSKRGKNIQVQKKSVGCLVFIVAGISALILNLFI